MENRAGKSLGTRQIAVIGMLSAVSILLGSTGFGFIPLPMAKATVMQIPVIIGAILEGPVVGISVGLIFGFFSIFQNITNPNILSFAFLNPLVSVLPRMLKGIAVDTAVKVIYGIALTNGIPEAVVAVIVTIPAVLAVKKVVGR